MKFCNLKKNKKRLGLSLILLTILLTSANQNAAAFSLNHSTTTPYFSVQTNQEEQIQHFSSQITSNEDTQPPNGRVEKFSITIPQLDNRERTIQVYLPPDYDTSDRVYPVFYLLDGEFLFNPPERGIGDYQIDETLERLVYEGVIAPMIVVGVEHDFDIPWSEYTPWINENMHDWVKESNSAPADGGEGLEFVDFIVETLKPQIDASYRTLPDRDFTAIGGFCRMGIIPLLAGFRYPDFFSKVMSMSPTVWLAEGGGRWLSNNHLIKYINDNPMPENVKFYIDVGTEEASGSRPPIKDAKGDRITYPQAYVEGAQILNSSLLENGIPKTNIYFQVIEGASGTRDEWAKRFDEAVVWLFEEEKLDEVLNTPTPPIEKDPVEDSQPIIKRTPIHQIVEFIKPKLSSVAMIGILAGGFLLLACFALFIGIKRNI